VTVAGDAGLMCNGTNGSGPVGPHDAAPASPASSSGPVLSLILRIWYEPGTPSRFRARGVQITPGRPERQVFTASTVAAACQEICEWLETAPADGIEP
jgi:hypothetical protein